MESPEIYTLQPAETLRPEEIEAIPRLLGAAAVAVTAPRQSGFDVRAAAINVNGDVEHGGNREYGLSRAYVHGEEAVVSKLLSEHPDVPLLGIGIYDAEESPNHLLPCPCGNCRDVLLEEATPDLLMVCGNEKVALATRLSSFLFDDYREADPDDLPEEELFIGAVIAAMRAGRRGTGIYLPPAMKDRLYGVALLDTAGDIYPGSFDTTAGYDAITPGVAAIQSYRNRPLAVRGGSLRQPRHDALPLEAVIIAGPDAAVRQVAYRDRNALKDFVEVLSAPVEALQATPVFLCATDQTGELQDIYQTDTTEWIPLSYSSGRAGHTGRVQAKRDLLTEFL